MLVALLAGDGIGQEIMVQARRVLDALDLGLSYEEAPVGGTAYKALGHPLPAETLAQIKSLDLGDIIGVSGVLGRSGKGDLYVDIRGFSLLTKSLRPLPDKFHGLTDTELRYRARHVDLIMGRNLRNPVFIEAVERSQQLIYAA